MITVLNKKDETKLSDPAKKQEQTILSETELLTLNDLLKKRKAERRMPKRKPAPRTLGGRCDMACYGQ
jgi:hypothetical protein